MLCHEIQVTQKWTGHEYFESANVIFERWRMREHLSLHQRDLPSATECKTTVKHRHVLRAEGGFNWTNLLSWWLGGEQMTEFVCLFVCLFACCVLKWTVTVKSSQKLVSNIRWGWRHADVKKSVRWPFVLSMAIISTVRPIAYNNPSRKRSFMKTLFIKEEFENAGLSFSCGQKTFWKRSFSKTMASR